MNKCPICDKELVKEYQYGSEHGLEESRYTCEGHYSETFAYGGTEIHIGEFMTGYHYTTPRAEVDKMNALIEILGAAHKLLKYEPVKVGLVRFDEETEDAEAFCPQCDEHLEDENWKFCHTCGTKLLWPGDVPPEKPKKIEEDLWDV